MLRASAGAGRSPMRVADSASRARHARACGSACVRAACALAEWVKGRRHIPAFGEWNQRCEELPIAQYFVSAMQAGHYYHAAAGEVLFRVASPPAQKPPKKLASVLHRSILFYTYCNVRSARDGMEKNQTVRMREGPSVVDSVVHGSRRPRVVRAIDEDLYKVPSELLRKRAKGRKKMRSLWMGCVGLNCVA
ncbi:hypothetical protein ABZP36_034088 [Zizania latifolia]